MKVLGFLVLLSSMFCCAFSSAVIDIAQIGSFGVIGNTTILKTWLAPLNKQFSFYRVYPSCIKDTTKTICKQNINWKNDLREYFYNGEYVNFTALDDQNNLNIPSSGTTVKVTLAPLLQQQQMSEDSLNVTVECDKKKQTVVLTTSAVSFGGQTAVASWQISFDKLLSGLVPLVDASKTVANAGGVAGLKASDMKLLRWYVNFTLADDDNGNVVFKDISLDLIVLSSITKKDAFTLFFTVPQTSLVAASIMQQLL